MRLLALETSGFSASLAALQAGGLLAELTLDPQQRSAQGLAPALRDLLRQVGWRPRQVEVVAVGIGPGSFTGLRVGVTTAKTFAYAVGADMVGVDTLEVVARQVGRPGPRRLVAAIDAGRGQVFRAWFQTLADGKLERVGAAELEAQTSWLASLTAGCLVTGPALEKLADQVPPAAVLAPRSCWSPRAATVGVLAAERHAAGQRDDVWKLAPCYMRRSAAEEKLGSTPRSCDAGVG